jgi:hypothetical protein
MEIGRPMKRHTVIPLKEPIPQRSEPFIPPLEPSTPQQPTPVPVLPERVE